MKGETRPSSLSACWYATSLVCVCGLSSANGIRMPKRRTRPSCCALAASGHAAAAPPKKVMNLRRRMGSLRDLILPGNWARP
jgi:hypothetical protein